MAETLKTKSNIEDALDIEKFKYRALRVVEILSRYLEQAKNKEIPVLSWQEPEEAIQKWKLDGNIADKKLDAILEEFIRQSNHLHSPQYAGHQVATVLPSAALAEFAYSFLNSTSTIYEMGPASYGIEQAIVCWLAEKLYIDTKTAGAVLTSGGSLGNLTALLAARQVKSGYDVWQEGIKPELAVIVSEQNHYSISRAAHIMGLGESSILKVKADENFKMRLDSLEEVFEQAQKDKKKIFAVCISACSTATGAYDDIDAIADFCEKHDLWLHVDGAHGASVALSEKYKYLIKGINRADSVVWDAHKMMAIPSLITAVIYKKRSESYATFSQQASYLLDENSIERDTCNRTVECTKPNMAFKLYLALAIHGEEFFADYIDYTHDLARNFAQLIESQDDFELAIQPESNIVCFRYKTSAKTDSELNKIQKEIRKKIVQSGNFYLVQTDLNGITYLRVSLMNPLTKISDLENLLDLVRKHALI